MTRDLFDIDQFMSSLAHDKELAKELVEAFLEDSPRRVAELREALEAEDAPRVTKLAHSLKGMCGVVRADVLSRLALEMEYAGRDGRLDAVRGKFELFVDSLGRSRELMEQFKAED